MLAALNNCCRSLARAGGTWRLYQASASSKRPRWVLVNLWERLAPKGIPSSPTRLEAFAHNGAVGGNGTQGIPTSGTGAFAGSRERPGAFCGCLLGGLFCPRLFVV